MRLTEKIEKWLQDLIDELEAANGSDTANKSTAPRPPRVKIKLTELPDRRWAIEVSDGKIAHRGIYTNKDRAENELIKTAWLKFGWRVDEQTLGMGPQDQVKP